MLFTPGRSMLSTRAVVAAFARSEAADLRVREPFGYVRLGAATLGAREQFWVFSRRRAVDAVSPTTSR